MSIPATVADVIQKHVVFETESIDRMYLNVMGIHFPQVTTICSIRGWKTIPER